jgi:glycosyltransferase involved in cell wall biosynthesis
VIPNCVADDLEAEVDESDARLDQLPATEFLLYVGRLDAAKGVNVLLEAYARMSSPPPLVMIGAGAPDFKIPVATGVTVLQDLPHAVVQSAWRRSLLGLVPSIWPEPCPTVALEAMAAGRVVVGSRVGGIPDLVEDGQTGVLVPPGDPSALGAAVTALVDDAPRRLRMGEAGKQRLATFKASSIVRRIEASYYTALGATCRAA